MAEELRLDVAPVELVRLRLGAQPAHDFAHDFHGCALVRDAELGHVLADALGGYQSRLDVEAADALISELGGEHARDAVERTFDVP